VFFGREATTADLDDLVISRYLRWRAETPGWRGRLPKPATVAKDKNMIGAAWKLAANKRWVAEFPELPKIRVPKRLPNGRAYTLEDVPFQIGIIELGANDMLRGLDPKRAQANLEQLISAFQAKGVRVLVATMVSSENWGQTYKANFDSIYPQLSRKYGVPLIPFMMEGVWGDPRLLIGDGLHPNAAGIAKMVDHMLPEVEKMLSSMASEKK